MCGICPMTELELIDRAMVERRQTGQVRAVKSLDSFDFKAIASLNKMLVLELARFERRRRSATQAPARPISPSVRSGGLPKGALRGFLTAAAVHELMARRRLLRLQKQLAKYHLLIIDELGFVPLSKTGAELLFEVFRLRAGLDPGDLQRSDEWTEIFGSIA